LDQFQYFYLSVRFIFNSRRLPETKRHSSLFLHLSGSKFLAVMVARTPSIRVFLGRPSFSIYVSKNIHTKFLTGFFLLFFYFYFYFYWTL